MTGGPFHRVRRDAPRAAIRQAEQPRQNWTNRKAPKRQPEHPARERPLPRRERSGPFSPGAARYLRPYLRSCRIPHCLQRSPTHRGKRRDRARCPRRRTAYRAARASRGPYECSRRASILSRADNKFQQLGPPREPPLWFRGGSRRQSVPSTRISSVGLLLEKLRTKRNGSTLRGSR